MMGAVYLAQVPPYAPARAPAGIHPADAQKTVDPPQDRARQLALFKQAQMTGDLTCVLPSQPGQFGLPN
jgi:hypothetical protein